MSEVLLPGDGFSTFEKADRVLVGLSGGVDSAVCAAILRQQGFEVLGAAIRFSPAHEQAVEGARAVAGALDVPLTVVDARAEFERLVVGPFCREYCAGRTPNPCVACNPLVKFRLLAETADRLGARFIATGHYARVVEAAPGVYALARAASAARDQSYMLYRLGQDILSRLCLPLGEFEKEDVRAMAGALALPCADAPDSMEICFIPGGDHAAFIESRGLSGKAGRFIGPDGRDLGPHGGVARYTVGQRKGLGLALGRPAFVKEIRENGDVALGWAGEEFYGGVALTSLCTPDGAALPAGRYLVKIRSAAAPAGCVYDGAGTVRFDTPARAPAPGQSAVFYRGEQVAGGGVIAAALA